MITNKEQKILKDKVENYKMDCTAWGGVIQDIAKSTIVNTDSINTDDQVKIESIAKVEPYFMVNRIKQDLKNKLKNLYNLLYSQDIYYKIAKQNGVNPVHLKQLPTKKYELKKIGNISTYKIKIDKTNEQMKKWFRDNPLYKSGDWDKYKFTNKDKIFDNINKFKKRIELFDKKAKHEVYDVEVEDKSHTFIANNILVHNSVYVSFDPLFKAMTEESQKKFDTDEKKLKFIEDFSRDFLNQQNNEWCENIYNPRHGHSYHEFELESIQKSQLVDKKKKYIKGVVWMKGKTYDEPHMSATGIEIVKSTTPKLCRTILTDLIRDMMFVSPEYKSKNEYAVYFNKLLEEKKKLFWSAPVQEISNSISIGDYKKYIIDDQDKFIIAPKCPLSVKAIGLFNYLAHKNGHDNLRMVSGKIKYYYIKQFGDTCYFGYPAGTMEDWYPKCDKLTCWDKNIIVPLNRFANVIHMPQLNSNSTYQLSLFDM